MRFCRKTIWLMVAVAALLPAGCASQRGRMASKREINTAQLLAAARQYEKEGQTENAAHIYEHVLTYHPTNSEAREGLILVRQGKLRVDYDTQQLIASTDPTIKQNPQARKQLAKHRKAKREQVNERMAQLIASAAKDPKTLDVDATPTPAMVASVTAEPQPMPVIAQADAVAPDLPSEAIETTAFATPEEAATEEQTPADWAADSAWTGHSLTNKCQDANAAVLAEVKKLEDNADAVRKEGLAKLAQMGPEAKSAAPAIRRLLNDQNQLVIAHAAWALWETAGDSFIAVEALQGLLDSKSTDVVQFAAYTLGNIGEEASSTAPKLQALLSHENSSTRLHAAEALTLLGNADQQGAATDTLLVLLKDEDAGVRSLAAMTLGQVGPTDADVAIAALTSALDDADNGVRSSAALSLGAFGDAAQPAVAKLEKTAKTDHTDVREAAETALACIKL